MCLDGHYHPYFVLCFLFQMRGATGRFLVVEVLLQSWFSNESNAFNDLMSLVQCAQCGSSKTLTKAEQI